MKLPFLILFNLFLIFGFAQKNANYYVEKSGKLFNKKEFQEALKVLDDAIIIMPDSAKLYDARGNYLVIFQLFDKAESDFSSALKLIEDSTIKANTLMNRASARTGVRNFDGAYSDLQQAVLLDSTNIGVYSNLAYVTDELNRPEEAMIYYNKIIEIDPSFFVVYINLGFRSQLAGEHKKALMYFDKASNLKPKDALIYSNRSYSKLKTGDIKGARKDIEKSIKMMPANGYAYKNRALIYLEEGNKKDACEDLFQANKLGYTEQYGTEVNDLMRKHCN